MLWSIGVYIYIHTLSCILQQENTRTFSVTKSDLKKAVCDKFIIWVIIWRIFKDFVIYTVRIGFDIITGYCIIFRKVSENIWTGIILFLVFPPLLAIYLGSWRNICKSKQFKCLVGINGILSLRVCKFLHLHAIFVAQLRQLESNSLFIWVLVSDSGFLELIIIKTIIITGT